MKGIKNKNKIKIKIKMKQMVIDDLKAEQYDE